MYPDRDTIARLLPSRSLCLLLFAIWKSKYVTKHSLESWCFPRLRLEKHQDSRENKTKCFTRDHTLTVWCSISLRLWVLVREWVQVHVAGRTYECENALGNVSACVGVRVSEWVGRKKADCKIIKYNSTKGEKWSEHYLLVGQTYVKCWCQELTHAAPDGCDDEHRRRRLLNHASETETSSTSKIINRSSDLINIFLAMAI